MRDLIDRNALTDDLFDEIVSLSVQENKDVRIGIDIMIDIITRCIKKAPRISEESEVSGDA